MSRCGHVYCWACILHYLALSDDKDRPCPICHQDINKADLRSVTVQTRHARNTGDIVSMTLMKRERNSVFAVPINKTFLTDHPEMRAEEEGGEAREEGVTMTDLDISTVQPSETPVSQGRFSISTRAVTASQSSSTLSTSRCW